MSNTLDEKLKTLPVSSGVYFHKSKNGEVIYVGKAAVLKNRVKSYFQKLKNRDPKTEALIAEIADTEWIETESEIDALFLEAEMIRRYMPRFNILLRDDKSLEYVRIDSKSKYPTVTTIRQPADDGAEYFGPYINGWAVKRALKHLRRIFPFAVKKPHTTMGSKLYEQLGLDPKLDGSDEKLAQYRSNLKKLAQYLRGDKKTLVKEIEQDMKRAAKLQEFELAARLRNQLRALQGLQKQIIFSDREFLDMSKDYGLAQLSELLALEKPPRRIEGYDISHMSGTNNVASMVVFTFGIPDKSQYRKFKMHILGNNDFAHINEAILRRLSPKNVKNWGLPDLFLIDGGKGQLGAALSARDSLGFSHIPMIGLAKREEEIVIAPTSFSKTHPELQNIKEFFVERAKNLQGIINESEDFILVELPKQSHIVKLLQRVRDESHRFAVSYHTVLKRAQQTKSILDDVPTIGPATRKKLIKTFGSTRGIIQARQFELEKVVGEKKAIILKQYLREYKKSDIK